VKSVYFKIVRIFFLKTGEFKVCFANFAKHKNKHLFQTETKTIVNHKSTMSDPDPYGSCTGKEEPWPAFSEGHRHCPADCLQPDIQ
jgi:hypothetical protein